MVLQFGAGVLRLVPVVSLAALLMRLINRRSSFNSDGLHCTAYKQLTGHGPEAIAQKNNRILKTGKFNSATVEQFAGASKINSSFHQQDV